MKEIIIASICIVAFLFCLAGIVIGFHTAIRLICEARDRKKPVKNYSAIVDCKLSMNY